MRNLCAILTTILAVSELAKATSLEVAVKVDYFSLVTVQDLSIATETLTQLWNTSRILSQSYRHKTARGNTESTTTAKPVSTSDCCRAKLCSCTRTERSSLNEDRHAIAWVLETLAQSLEDTLREIDALLNTTPNVQKRNILGDIISSITGLATHEQLERTIELITTSNDQADRNLLSVVQLSTIQHSMEKQLAQTNQFFTEVINDIIPELDDIATNTHILTYAIRLTSIVDTFRRKWERIVESLMHNRPNYHTLPGEAMQRASIKFERFYGKVNQDIKMGVLDKDKKINMLSTMKESTVHFYLYDNAASRKLVTNADIPLFKQGFKLTPLREMSTHEYWIATNQHNTEGVLIYMWSFTNVSSTKVPNFLNFL